METRGVEEGREGGERKEERMSISDRQGLEVEKQSFDNAIEFDSICLS